MSLSRGASVLVIASTLVLAGCGSMRGGASNDGGGVSVSQPTRGFSLLGKKDKGDAKAQQGIGVNSYLWRASLDTLSFMPLASADPWGGVIITDWYSDPATPDERFKATVYILDTRLRADALAVTVHKQVRADRKSTRLNSSHTDISRMPSSA